jgi:hypothetical protein
MKIYSTQYINIWSNLKILIKIIYVVFLGEGSTRTRTRTRQWTVGNGDHCLTVIRRMRFVRLVGDE